MRLKSLVLHGFKSFADRTAFTFDGHGVTCIVGPNGCGKSNVMDAVKWILGEQRPTSLRGKDMGDVIFNGTVRRPPMGLCEGTLVFDNASGTLPLDAPEVSVTRRVFRSGETEYLVNGQSTRLKDLRDLFAGTGLGHGGYGFMEQGKIDSILASNAVERRKVFEEAAGISRFRTRRRETELKLARVEDNLTRLHDITEEIARQIRSLKIHAGKARSYHELTRRGRELQLRWNRHRYHEIRAEQDRLQEVLGTLGAEKDGRVAERDRLREAVREVEGELQTLLDAVGEARTRAAEVNGRIEAGREKVELHTGWKEELSDRSARRRGEIAELEQRLESLREERVLARREHEELEQVQGQIAERRAVQEASVQGLQERARCLRDALTTADGAVRAVEARASEVDRDAARLEAACGHARERIEGSERRIRAVREERAQLREQLGQRSAAQQEQTSVLEEWRLRLTEVEAFLERLDRDLAATSKTRGERESEASNHRARIDVLTGHMARREGLDEGARALLEARDRDTSFLPGLRGLLGDLIEVAPQDATAVEAALGDHATALVVASMDDVVQGLDFLRKRGLGGARFLPLDRYEAGSPAPSTVQAGDPDVAALVGALLEGFTVVSATELERGLSLGTLPGALVVTTGGTVVRSGRSVAVPRPREISAGLVVLQAELRQRERDLPAIERVLGDLREREAALGAERGSARARSRELGAALLEQEGEAARLDQEIARLVSEVARLDAEDQRLQEERQAAEGERARDEERLAALRTQRTADVDELRTEQERLDAARLATDEHGGNLEAGARELQELRIEEARASERLEGLGERRGRIARTIEDLDRRLADARQEVEELGRNQEKTLGQIRDELSALERLQAEAQESGAELQRREAAASEVRGSLRGATERLEAMEEELAGIAERHADARGRAGELKAAMENLQERTREELEIELEELLAREAEAPESGEDVDWKAVEQEIRALRDRVARLGNVNMAAVEELEEAEGRSELLFREQADLDQSRVQLQKVLREIEQRSTALFLETFNAVKEHFSVLFRKLFGGGKAEILLENPDEPLESGIEIRARPPGKELRSITLLSGGERTMTAVSLLFAIFRANPAPCADLDALDAALDEDNTERFCRLLDEFLERSQFVIVTHSRRTMERADMLLGVTMPERGVSRPITVRLEQIGDDGAIAAADAAAASPASETAPDEAADSPVGRARLEAPAVAHRARRTTAD